MYRHLNDEQLQELLIIYRLTSFALHPNNEEIYREKTIELMNKRQPLMCEIAKRRNHLVKRKNTKRNTYVGNKMITECFDLLEQEHLDFIIKSMTDLKTELTLSPTGSIICNSVPVDKDLINEYLTLLSHYIKNKKSH